MKKNTRTKVKCFARKINKYLKDFKFREFQNFHFYLRIRKSMDRHEKCYERTCFKMHGLKLRAELVAVSTCKLTCSLSIHEFNVQAFLGKLNFGLSRSINF